MKLIKNPQVRKALFTATKDSVWAYVLGFVIVEITLILGLRLTHGFLDILTKPLVLFMNIVVLWSGGIFMFVFMRNIQILRDNTERKRFQVIRDFSFSLLIAIIYSVIFYILVSVLSMLHYG